MAQYLVSGSISPDATGTYNEAGTYGGATYYTSGSWYLFWSTTYGNWFIGDELTEGPSVGWYSETTDILGTYFPYTGTTGDATVTLSSSEITAYPAAVSVTFTAVRPHIRVIVAPVTVTLSVVAPSRVVQPDMVAATWTPVVPTLRKTVAVSAVSATWSGVEPTTAKNRTIAVSPVAVTWSVPALGGTAEAVAAVAVAWTVNPVTVDRAVVPAPVVITVTPTTPERRAFPDPVVATWSPVAPQVFRGRYYLEARGLYRVFNAAGYRFYRSNSAPPAEGSSVWATAASLPNTPSDTFADGTWWVSASYFNGVLDSGFLAIGDRGETYRKLVISGGVASAETPQVPLDWRIERQASGVVRVVAIVYVSVASEWAIGYTSNGADPLEDLPDTTGTLAEGVNVVEYDLPAATHGATVKVRFQIRRNDGTVDVPVWVYSDGSTVKSLTADTTGPSVPVGAERSERPVVEV